MLFKVQDMRFEVFYSLSHTFSPEVRATSVEFSLPWLQISDQGLIKSRKL
jgi:hypothetical protein